MNIAAILLDRLLLATVFAVAGVAKLADRAGSRQAIVDFGLPARLATLLGILLPLYELAVAAALIPTPTAWWGAVGGARAPAHVHRWHQHQPCPRTQARVPLLWPALLRPCRLEDTRPQRRTC